MKKLVAMLIVLGLAFSLFAGGQADSGKKTVRTVGISMPTKSSARWIADGGNMKAEFEKLGFKVDLQYA